MWLALATIFILLALQGTQGELFSQCFDAGHCFYSDGQHKTQRSRTQYEEECSSLKKGSKPLELHEASFQEDLKSFLASKQIDADLVLLNLLRVDLPWTWLDFKNYSAEAGPTDYKKFHIDTRFPPFASVNRLSMSIAPNPNPAPRSHLTEFNMFLCSFEGMCDKAEKDNFQVEGTCFTYHNKRGSNWLEAYSQCKSNGKTLAIIPPSLLPSFKTKAAEVLPMNQPHWIGLSKMQWQWRSRPGQLISYYNWYSGYPRPNLITEAPDKVFAILQPKNDYIWMDYNQLPNVTLVCMTKTSEEGWNESDEDSSSIGSGKKGEDVSELQPSSDTVTLSKAGVVAVPVVLAVLLLASLLLNLVLALYICKKPKEVKCEEKKEVITEYFNYE